MTTTQLKSLLCGGESLLVQCAERLRARGHSIVGVVTEDEAIQRWAVPLEIPVFTPGPGLPDRLAAVEYQWLFSIANLRVLPKAVWSRASRGAVNFHDGPLPSYAGLNAPAWAILGGERSHGITWHAISARLDEGEIYAQRVFGVDPDETALTLNTKCYEAAIESFEELIEGLEDGSLVPRRQDLSARSYFSKQDRPAAGATLRFERPAAELAALVRALDYGAGYANPLLMPKLRTAEGLYGVTALDVLDETSGDVDPGTVIRVDDRGAVVAAADRHVLLRRIVRVACGSEVSATTALQGVRALPLLPPELASRITELTSEIVKSEDFFAARLEDSRPIDLPDVEASPGVVEARIRTKPISLPAPLSGPAWVSAISSFLARATGHDVFDLGFRDDAISALAAEVPGYFASAVPLRVNASGEPTFGELDARVRGEIVELARRRTYVADLVARRPGTSLPRYTVALVLTSRPESAAPVPGAAITFVLPVEGKEALLFHDISRFAPEAADSLVARLSLVLQHLEAETRVHDVPLMSEDERGRVLYAWNSTERDYDRSACAHTLFERQVDASPDATALVWGAQTLTYSELDRRANRIAHALRRRGVAPDVPVGLHCRRSLELVIGALAIQKAGGCYLPLDPTYPAARVARMIEDSGTTLVLVDHAPGFELRPDQALAMDDASIAAEPDVRVSSEVRPNDLAYVIYTSGSTGRPKGVMVEHRNVVNFFAGMDDRIPRTAGEQPTWLAVTSLSFDISVLELFWTLSRGFKVVIASDEDRVLHSAGAAPSSDRPMAFGLMYWGNDDGQGREKYRLLLEGARFADANGFQALWTPERHFHAFGGPYPNPSVTCAAVAAVTERLEVRGGSVVLPLHHPARVAEEWAVVDNLSNGRVGIGFASGWMPEDFLLRPENSPPKNKPAMIRDVEIVRRLWRGEPVEFESPDGKRTSVVTQPRPVQPELPVWITTAGNPDTYRDAASLGANVLTHLLGQSIAELSAKIEIYRQSLRASGKDPDAHKVTLMLHTLVGASRDEVRALARAPMKQYLRSAAALIKQYAWAFPAFKRPAGVKEPTDIDLRALAPEELDAILEFAFARYFDDSGLFGTVDDCLLRIDELKRIGVDEIACLVDYGVPTDLVLESLEHLAAVVRRASRPVASHACPDRPAGRLTSSDPTSKYPSIPSVGSSGRARPANLSEPAAGLSDHAWVASDGRDDYGIAAQIARHRVTHLQCTPSMLRMLAMNDETRAALGSLSCFFVGGEPLPGALVEELAAIAPDAIVENMYGPTETTIWSSTHRAAPCAGTVPLGRPIANTQLYVLDERRRPLPIGVAGELYIGGDGVARGYLNRDELTRERFLADPFREGGRMYRTGDRVRRTEDGTLIFLGRVDHQVKVRGHRIELGEIESRLAGHPSVREALVLAQEDAPGGVRLVAYVRLETSAAEQELRSYLREMLPGFMIPAHFVQLERFPLTANGKIDRKALPKPEALGANSANAEYVAPESGLERVIAEVYEKVLGVPRVGLRDNFFELGGHSLLAVQAHRELSALTTAKVTITDIFRFPTVRQLADYLEDRDKAGDVLDKVADRAAARREATGRRGLRRARARE